MAEQRATAGPRPLRVVVAVLTLHRPVGLHRALESLLGLDVPEDVEASVLVVDNDPDGSARPTVESLVADGPIGLRYVVEPRRGIPQARNRAVVAGRPYDVLAFIDDDEIADRAWLRELLRVRAQTGAHVVTGPVVAEFEVPPPPWIVRGRFFERPRFADGAPLTWATTSSVVIDAAVLGDDDQPFNEEMRLTGGSDTHLFWRAHLAGHPMAWADRAEVVETIPASRARLGWILRREYRRGITLSLCVRDLEPGMRRRLRQAASGAKHLAIGAVLLVAGVAQGRAGVARGLHRGALGAGILVGLAGVRYDEYRTVHGR